MPGAEIRFDQAANPIPVGTPGVARDDIWLSQPVVCRSVLSGNTAWQWSFLDVPPGSAAVFSGSTTPTATFTPDIPGTYRIQLITNSGGLGNIVVLVVRVRYSSTGVLLFHGLCLPAFGERVNEDNVLVPPITGSQNERGYAPFFEAILAYVLTLSGGGGPPWTQDCSVGGTINYAGPTTVPSKITLTGTPGGFFTFEMNNQPFISVFVNETGQVPAITTPANPGLGTAIGTVPVLLTSDGTLVRFGGQPTGSGDIQVYNASDGVELDLFAIGTANATSPGVVSNLPIYGTMLNRQDAVASGVTPPAMGDGPVPMQVGEVEWEAMDPGTGDCLLTYGRNAISQSGVGVVSNPEIRFASARGSQRSTKLEGVWGDTLTGPSESGAYVFDIPPGTTMLRIKATAAITVAGGSDTVGDAFTTETTAAWANVSSVVTQLTADRGEPFEFFNPAGNMAGTSFSVSTSGTQAYVAYGTNGTIAPGNVCGLPDLGGRSQPMNRSIFLWPLFVLTGCTPVFTVTTPIPVVVAQSDETQHAAACQSPASMLCTPGWPPAPHVSPRTGMPMRAGFPGSVPLSDLTQSGAMMGQVIKWNGSAWVPGSGGSFVPPTGTGLALIPAAPWSVRPDPST